MHCTLLVPGLLPATDAAHARMAEEAARVVADLRLPALERLLARARRNEDPGASAESWLIEACGGDGEAELPAGALAQRIAAHAYNDADTDAKKTEGPWLRADPVHLRLNRDQLLLIPSSLFEVKREDAEAILAALNAHFAGELEFRALDAGRWCARVLPGLAPAAQSLRTVPLPQAAGRDVNAQLPEGPAAMRWHGLLNELQMLLYSQPTNDARESRGEPAINSVWLWGAGALPDELDCPWDSVTADDAYAQGLAQASGLRHRALPADGTQWLERMPTEGRHLVVLESLRMPYALGDLAVWRGALEALERDWFAPLHDALSQGRIGMITLVSPAEDLTRGFEAMRGDLRKFWRRVKPVAHWI